MRMTRRKSAITKASGVLPPPSGTVCPIYTACAIGGRPLAENLGTVANIQLCDAGAGEERQMGYIKEIEKRGLSVQQTSFYDNF